MLDLHLWRMLHADAIDARALTPLLRALSAAPLRERFPFLGAIARVATNEDAGLRAAAVLALAGADGPIAFRVEVSALDDADDAAREAAVESLRASSEGHPARFAHALFHADRRVRALALGGDLAGNVSTWSLALAADPIARAAVLARLDADAHVSLPDALPLVLDLARRDDLDRAHARRLVLKTSWPAAAKVLGASGADDDALDLIVDLLVTRAEDPPLEAGAKDPLRSLAAAVGSWDATLRDRTIVALRRLLDARGDYPDDALGFLAAFEPEILADAKVPLDARRRAALGLYTYAANAPKIPDERARALLDADVFWKTTDLLDLDAVGAFLHLFQNHPYKRLIRWVGADTIVDSFFADLRQGLRFFSLDDPSRRGKRYLLERIARARPLEKSRVTALLAIAADESVLGELDGDAAAETAMTIAAMLAPPAPRLRSEKLERLTKTLGRIFGSLFLGTYVRAWAAAPIAIDDAFAGAVLAAMAEASEAPAYVEAARALDRSTLRDLLERVSHANGFPFSKERALAEAFASHEDDDVRAWAVARLPKPEAPRPPPPGVRDVEPLEADAIASATTLGLTALVECLRAPSRGLAAALARRPVPGPEFKACVALLAAHDPIEAVDAELIRFADDWSRVDRLVAQLWLRSPHLPLLGNAWLHRWEQHAFAAADEMIRAGLAASLARLAALRCRPVAREAWSCAASVLSMWRWREKAKLAAVVDDAVFDRLIDALPTDLGEPAAKALMAIVESQLFIVREAELRARVIERLPDLEDRVRAVLASWIDARGLAAAARRRIERTAEEEMIDRVRRSFDLDFLEATCRATNAKLAQEAALRLLAGGESGADRLVRVILERPPALPELAEAIAIWPDGPSLDRLRARADDPTGGEVPFRIAIALAHRGDLDRVNSALAAGAAESDPWLRHADIDELRRLGVSEDRIAIAFAVAIHPHAYRRAVEHLIKHGDKITGAGAALRGFLEHGTSRLITLRRSAARWLFHRGDTTGYPILLEEHADAGSKHLAVPNLLEHASGAIAVSTMDAIFTAGTRVIAETLARDLAAAPGVDADNRDRCHERILVEARHAAVRAAAAAAVPRRASRAVKLREIAESFAWGIRIARQLTGRVFKIDMIDGRALGYTRLHENRIHVTPLPILNREPQGRTVVEGLVLHEIGHHVHHRGEIADAFWKKAASEGIQGLFNFVLDEHLERNLRARDADFGDTIKVLDAWAFQHASRELPVDDLVMSLLGRSFDVLTATKLEIARTEGCVKVSGGAVLHHMEQSGLSFSRFLRALRMGLGDRHNDPRVARALSLFKVGFRHKSMADLYAIAKELRAIFGWETRIVERFGGHETAPGDGADLDVHGEGITNDEVEQEVERILDPNKRPRGSPDGKGGGKAWINVAPDESFRPITKIVKVPFDSSAHAVYARAVARDAHKMRRYLEELGLAYEPQRFRLQGKRFDRSRTNALVIRGDPRVLIARELRPHTDLFLGIVIDCSGSMQTRDNLEKAKHFGVLLAEAARGLRGVTVRVFGFTDTVIYDAGDAQHCAAHALVSSGGNNDAAALHHVANVALASRRKAKLVVMISDGLPTECSVDALRALVRRLGKKNVCCAQVAVQKLAEVCFPHYVVLDANDRGASVTKFGAIVAGLVRKAIAAA